MRSLGITAAAVVAAMGLVVAPVLAETQSYSAALSAGEETPIAGPAGGTGTAKVVIDMATKQVCYELTWSKEVESPSAAHIHRGPKGTNGPIVVNFDLPKNGPKACVAGDELVLNGIAADPGGHYVNIHNSAYPNGAVRGQLQAG
jgi:hypothetical protein